MSQSTASHQSSLLVDLVLILLTPMFLCIGDGDILLARRAALETLNAYRVPTALSLITVAKIIAFELATICSLSQSMTEDITPQLALRFRSNANTLDRSSERNRQALEQQRIPAGAERLTQENAAAAVAEAQEGVQQAVASLQATSRPAAAPAMSDEQRRTAWAQAMASVAAEFTADLDKLPPAERAKEMIRINTLTQSASALVAGIAPPDGDPARQGASA